MTSIAIAILLFAWHPSQLAVDERSKLLDPYLDVVTQYREGQLEVATKELATWPETRVHDTIERLRKSKGAYEVISANHEVRYTRSSVRALWAFNRRALTSKPYEQLLAQRVSRQDVQEVAVRSGASVPYSSMASFSQP